MHAVLTALLTTQHSCLQCSNINTDANGRYAMRQEMQSALCSQHDYVWLLRHAQHVQSPTHCPDQVTRVCYTHPVYVNSRMVVLRSSDTVALQLEWLLGLLVYKHCGQGTCCGYVIGWVPEGGFSARSSCWPAADAALCCFWGRSLSHHVPDWII